MEHLLLRLVADAARVVENQVGLRGRFHLLIAAASSVPTTFSESCTFIWQPNVSR
jgi:hypothetical protein